jgi:hypothetical protein|nr:hypothetical protein [Kofleriaceae bacterium]
MDLFRLAAVVGAATLACACGRPHDPGGDGGGSGAHGAVTALAISPGSATIELAPVGAGYTAMETYQVVATYADGASEDVSATAVVSAVDPSIAFAGPTATATVVGEYPISAELAGTFASATLDVALDASATGSGFDPGAGSGLDGTPVGGQLPSIAYPLDGALFPVNIAPIEVHVQKSDASQTVARISLTSGDLLAFHYYAPCAPSPNPAQFPDACIVDISGAFASQLAGASALADVQLQVRLAAADGSMLGESTPIAVAWAGTALTGGLYYWTTAGANDTAFNTAIARYDFDGDASQPSIYLSSADAPAVPNGQPQCIGCHSLSPDGKQLAFSMGGSLPGYYALYDVATRTATATNFTDKFANMSTFSPDGSRAITMAYGDLTLRTTDASLTTVRDGLFPQIAEQKSHPFWSPQGNHLAFVSWTPTAADQQAGQVTGDMVQGAQIWIASSTGSDVSEPATLLVPRADGVTSYYPAISDDDRFVVFDQSSCSGPANTPGGWGGGACDGYNDISATLQLIGVGGGTPIALAKANGGAAPLTTNSWPRWSPDHGTFRGQRLYWVAFSSRRPYGLSLASGAGVDTTKPQLWFAAIAVPDDGSAPAADPSFAPVWLPGQDPDLTGPRGNHTPVWTSKAISIE